MDKRTVESPKDDSAVLSLEEAIQLLLPGAEIIEIVLPHTGKYPGILTKPYKGLRKK